MAEVCLVKLLILSVVVVCCGSISVSIKGLYCKDPDDNTFHPVNTTWQAKSFCGNYTCKIREKSGPQMKEDKLEPVVLTAVNKARTVEEDASSNNTDLGIYGAENSVLVELVTQDIVTTTEMNLNADVTTTVKPNDNDNVFNIDKIIDESTGSQIISANNSVKEINANLNDSNKTEVVIDWNDNNDVPIANDTKITKNFFNENSQQKEEILRKVEDKMYNTTPDDGDRLLTQEEINTITKLLHTVKKSDLEALIEVYTLTKDIFKELQSREKDSIKEQNKKVKNQYQYPTAPVNSMSYFYEPIIDQSLKDLHSADTNTVFSTVPSPSVYVKPESSLNPYAIPYFYRISDFQKLPHGYRHKHIPDMSPNVVVKQESSPCNVTVHMTNNDNMLNSKTQSSNEHVKGRQHYTYFDYPSYLYSNQISYPNYLYFHPWSLPLKMPNNVNQGKSEILDNEPPKVIESSAKIIERRNDDRSVVVPKFKSKIDKLPSWQTESLSQQVLEEVKSNVHAPDNLLLNKIRGAPKLERVGKLLNLDSVLRRRKRGLEQNSAEEMKVVVLPESQYEVYVDKIECGQSTEPGFFSHGNKSLPYPNCCPSKIENPKV